MRIQTVIFAAALVVLSLVKYSDAVACSDTVTTDCTDCTLAANADDPDCVTTVAPTTVATDTTTTASTATTTTVPPTTGGGAVRRLLRRIRRLQRRLDQCRKHAANQRAYFLKQIKQLSSKANANSNNFKDKFFG